MRDDVGPMRQVATMCSAVDLIQETCAVMALPRLARISRAASGVLERLHCDEIVATPEMLGDLLAAVHALSHRLGVDGDSATASARTDDELIARLVRWRGSREPRAEAESVPHDRVPAAVIAVLLDEIHERLSRLALVAHHLTLFPWTARDDADECTGRDGNRTN